MGKYSGKVLTVYITPTGVRVAEGENKNGSPVIDKFFVVRGVEEFFTEVQGNFGSYEVTNMSALVDAIVNECRNNNAKCRRVMLSSNCFGIKTKAVSEESKGSIKDLLTGDLLGGSNPGGKKKEKKVKQSIAPDKMMCKIPWGDLAEDGRVTRKFTESLGDKFVLKSLVQEFYKRGYDVISIADNIGSLINFRHTEEASFDAQGKIIFDFDTQLHVLAMNKDMPVGVDLYPPMTNDEILERIDNLIVGLLDNIGRNPKIYLTGSLMEDTLMYSTLIDRLETSGYVVYDLFDRPQTDPFTGCDPVTGAPVLTPDFSVNIAMFMSAYAKAIVSILPAIEFSEVFKKNSKAIATVFLLLSVVTLCVSGYFAFNRFMEMQIINGAPPQVASLEGQISNLESSQASLNSTIETLTKADVTVLELLNFVERNQTPFVKVISVDTVDMLPASVSVQDYSLAGTPDASTVGEVTTTSGRQEIVLRGYARTDTAAIGYYNQLFNAQDWEQDPVLSGIMKTELPNGEEVHIFEIRLK